MVEEINLITKEWLKQLDERNLRLESPGALQDFISKDEAIISCYVKSDMSSHICEEIVSKIKFKFGLSDDNLLWILSDTKITYRDNWFSPKKRAKSFLLHIKNLD